MFKLVDVQDKYGRVVLKVGSTVTSIGASYKAGFPVCQAIRGGKVVWVQNGEPVPSGKTQYGFWFERLSRVDRNAMSGLGGGHRHNHSFSGG